MGFCTSRSQQNIGYKNGFFKEITSEIPMKYKLIHRDSCFLAPPMGRGIPWRAVGFAFGLFAGQPDVVKCCVIEFCQRVPLVNNGQHVFYPGQRSETTGKGGAVEGYSFGHVNYLSILECFYWRSINFLDVYLTYVYTFEKRMFVTRYIKDCDMARNLDMTALRSFVAVAETGGVTRAAGQLHLTQSAVSMQLKRLEEALGQTLLDRANRSVSLTAQGELLLSYGRRLLSLNDEVWNRMTDQVYEGELVLGVPHDIVYPHIPSVLKKFAAEYPRVKVQLISSFSTGLIEQFVAGKADIILTTEQGSRPDAVKLTDLELVWLGAPDGVAWKQRPLRLAYETRCIFRPMAQKALDDVAIPWEMGVESESSMTVEASLSADLAVHARLRGTAPYLEEIPHNGELPDLPEFQINMMVAPQANTPLAGKLAEMVRMAYCCA